MALQISTYKGLPKHRKDLLALLRVCDFRGSGWNANEYYKNINSEDNYRNVYLLYNNVSDLLVGGIVGFVNDK